MSISDNEDLDTKPPARRLTTEEGTSSNSRYHHHHHRQTKKRAGGIHHGCSSDDEDGNADGSRSFGRRRHEKIIFTAKQQTEISYRRTASLLMGEGERLLHHESAQQKIIASACCSDNNNYFDNKKNGERDSVEITVIPSLVSLSKDFFRRPSSAAAAATPAAKNLPPASFPELSTRRPVAASSSASLSAASLAAGRRDSHVVASRAVANLRPRVLDPSYYSSARHSLDGENEDAPSANWPVGPQGAPIPSYLLSNRDEDPAPASSAGDDVGVMRSTRRSAFAQSNDNRMVRSTSSNSLDNETVASSDNLQSPRSSFLIREPPLSAPPFGLGDSNGRRNITTGGTSGVRAAMRHSRRLPQQREESYVNVVRSLEHAVKRLENRWKDSKSHATSAGTATAGATTKPNGGNHAAVKDIEELESDVLTRLAEIMLHPPTALVENQLCWDDEDDDEDDDDSENTEDAMDSTITLHPRDKQARYSTIQSIQLSLTSLFATIPRRVCQYPFKRNDIVWVCRTCQSDETCVLCHECFTHSDHEGHDVAFYHAQAGGCCDCGDPDAWDPKGFCPRHGGPGNGCAAGCNTAVNSEIPASPSVLGSVHACADYLVEVVRSGVEGGYRRANLSLFQNPHCKTALLEGLLEESGEMTCRSDSLLPEHYDERDGGRGRRRGRSRRKARSLERRNTVADVETTNKNESLPSSPAALFGEGAEAATAAMSGSMEIRNSSALLSNDINDINGDTGIGAEPTSSTLRMNPPSVAPAVHHEARFDPAMASTSKKFSHQSIMSLDSNNDDCVFDPQAAGSSKLSPPSNNSSSSSISLEFAHQPATKKARAPNDDDRDPYHHHATKTVPPKVPLKPKSPKTPARALGDLGREEHGLFLVLHCDGVHMGGLGMQHNNEVISALKELYSAPGGGSSGGGNAGGTGNSAGGSADAATGSAMLGVAFGGNRQMLRQRAGRPLLALGAHPPATTTTTARLFRAPHAEAILDKIVRIVTKRGDLIVWGTQELIAECGDVASACWLDGDPRSTALLGAAMLDRAKILTDRGLVCSIKTLKDLREEQTATAILKLVGWVASSCDPLCERVSTGIAGRIGASLARLAVGQTQDGAGPNVAHSITREEQVGADSGGGECLRTLLRNDLKLPFRFVEAWHSLLLTLLAVPNFKAAMANAYCDTYRDVTAEYARGVGLIEQSSFTLSVQFLNRVSYVTDLVRERNLLSNLSRCLLETMRSASFIPGTPGAPHPAGSSSDILNDLEDARRGSTTGNADPAAVAVLAVLGFSATEAGDGDSGNLLAAARLDSEIEDMLLHGGLLERGVGGGDSRHHGRSSVARSGIKEPKNIFSNLIERTAALIPPTLDPSHTVLLHRRYSVCISDLKCVLNVDGMARHFASFPVVDRNLPFISANKAWDEQILTDCALADWIKTLSLAQNMDGQMWRPWVKGHVETEPKGWVGAFNASISLSSLFERLLNWDDGDPSPIIGSTADNTNTDTNNTGKSGDNKVRLLSCVELTHYTLTQGLHHWQRSEMLSHRPTRPPTFEPNPKAPAYALCPSSLPFSTVAMGDCVSAPLAMAALPLAQIAVWSFHLPLHRFVAACIREVARRHDVVETSNTNPAVGAINGVGTGGGLANLLQMFALSEDVGGGKDNSSQRRQNALLFRGLMEFPTIVLSRAAQIRAGLWRRNGPGMSDQVLNYSEPPFCRPLADADILLLQFALICHASSSRDDVGIMDQSIGGLAFRGTGTLRLVNLLIHRFGIFDFLGFEKAPNANVDQYKRELEKSLYPPEISVADDEETGKMEFADNEEESPEEKLVLPWTYSPVQDSAMCLNLVEELLHLIIILITEMPPPSPLTKNDHALEAHRRLKREVIHRLSSGNKTHSEMAEVHHVLPHRDVLVLSEVTAAASADTNAVSDSDAANPGGQALEDALGEVAARKHHSGSPDEWELRTEAWEMYDPAFCHISVRAHQSAAERRPRPPTTGGSRPYAPRPSVAHSAFRRIRRDLTSDACVLAVAYRVLHVHCHEESRDNYLSNDDAKLLRGEQMYEKEIKSETVLARAVHLLTLGAYTWGDDQSSADKDETGSTNWRGLGGGDVGSVFHDRSSPPRARDWIDAALLREPSSILKSEWYRNKETTLQLLQRIAVEGRRCGGCGFLGGLDPSLCSGAQWLCDFAGKFHPNAVTALADKEGRGSSSSSNASRDVAGAVVRTGEEELERKKNAAKERAMAAMKAQMAKFAANISPGFDEGADDNDCIIEDRVGGNMSPLKVNTTPNFSTPVRNRSDSTGTEAIQAMDLSTAGDFLLVSPANLAPNKPPPQTPRTPGTPVGSATPQRFRQTSSHHLGKRLLWERPQCIICGNDNDPIQLDNDSLRDSAGMKPGKASSNLKAPVEGEISNQETALAFCGYAQASTVMTNNADHNGGPSHVCVHITLCGHAIHKSCCDSWQRDDRLADRLEGVKRREFRCPLCQRLSNCLVPFVDVGADWVVEPRRIDNDKDTALGFLKSEEKPMAVDSLNSDKSPRIYFDGSYDNRYRRCSLHNFLNTSKWWATRNDESVSWDGQCTFVERRSDDYVWKPSSSSDPSMLLPTLSRPLPARQSLRNIQSKFGKRELIGAWNSVLRTPRIARQRMSRSSFSATDHSGSSSPDMPMLEKESNSGVTDVLRRFLDQVSEVGHRADMRRMGEEDLLDDFGEFRHYLNEKVSYNRVNRAAGKEMVDWPMCLSSTSLTETRRQELSREKLISKLLFSIQAFTYSCCSEASEARALLRDSESSSSSAAQRSSILSKFGIDKVLLGGDFLLLPEPDPTVDDGSQPFNGRLGKLRYLALALMVATSPVGREVVQLCVSFPTPEPDPFDFEQHEKSSIKRSPVAYPILCGHILTHTVGALIAVTGRARAEEGKYGIDSVVDDCRNFVQMGLVARVAQMLLARLTASFEADSVIWEQQVYSIIEQNILPTPAVSDPDEREWSHFCVAILHSLVSLSAKESQHTPSRSHFCSNDLDGISSQILQVMKPAKTEAVAFLRDISLVCQIIIPNFFGGSSATALESNGDEVNDPLLLKQAGDGAQGHAPCNKNETTILKRYMTLFHMENLYTVLESDLLQQIVRTWKIQSNVDSTEQSSTNLLDFPRTFYGTTWPVTTRCSDQHDDISWPSEVPPTCLPLLGNCSFLMKQMDDSGSSPSRIFYLPKSYTDLYAELSEMCPDIEQTALCLVCGQVLNAAGKGECTKHAYKCGGGAGIFFLVQECVGLILHGQKAAYVHSPYVDFYGETPQYRGRPLNLDSDRYRILRSLWSGHLVREKVIADRASTRQVIIQNYY